MSSPENVRVQIWSSQVSANLFTGPANSQIGASMSHGVEPLQESTAIWIVLFTYQNNCLNTCVSLQIISFQIITGGKEFIIFFKEKEMIPIQPPS